MFFSLILENSTGDPYQPDHDCQPIYDLQRDCFSVTAGKSDSDTVQNYIYTSVTIRNCVELPFYWLYCDTLSRGLLPAMQRLMVITTAGLTGRIIRIQLIGKRR